MRVVFDTNVLIAAFISQGVCAKLFEHCISRHQIVTSDFISDEVFEHLLGKFKYPLTDAESVIRVIKSQVEMVVPLQLPTHDGLSRSGGRLDTCDRDYRPGCMHHYGR